MFLLLLMAINGNALIEGQHYSLQEVKDMDNLTENLNCHKENSTIEKGYYRLEISCLRLEEQEKNLFEAKKQVFSQIYLIRRLQSCEAEIDLGAQIICRENIKENIIITHLRNVKRIKNQILQIQQRQNIIIDTTKYEPSNQELNQ